jgi:hypothetical protein
VIQREMWKNRRLLKFWQRVSGWAVTLEGEITWWSGDDVHLRKRKVDMEIQVPRSIWRPWCWTVGKHEEGPDGDCVVCAKILRTK